MIRVVVALAGSALLFVPGLLEQFETPKIELVRALGLGSLVYGLISGLPGLHGFPVRWSWVDRAVAAWLAVEIATTALSVSPLISVVGETRQREGLLTSLALAGMYVAARGAFADRRRIGVTLDVMLGIATLVGLYAVVQATGHDPLQWRRQAVYAGAYARPFATLGHANVLGVLCAAVSAVGLALAIAGGGTGRWLRGGAALLLGMVAILTLSRAAWLGAAAGFAIAAILAARGRGRVLLAPRTLLVAAGALVLVASVVALTGAWRLVAQRVAELLAGGGGSGGSRLEIWRAALAAWQARPLTGHGPDLFEMVFPQFQTAVYWRLEWSGLPFHAHSIYLYTLATRGVLGTIAALGWAAALIAAAAAAWRRRADLRPPGLVPAACGLLAACAVSGAFGALGISGALLVVLVSAMLAAAAEPASSEPAAAAAPVARGGRGKSPARGRDAPPRFRAGAREWAARIAAWATTVAALLWGFTELRASRAGSAAQAFMTRAPARAVSASGHAVALAPHDDRLWRMHAQTLLWLTTVPDPPAGTQAEAERAARRAVALAPARAENRIILARALGAREAAGDTTAHAAADAEFRRSLALAPMDGLALMEYADHEAILGRPATALEAARRAVALYPGEGPAWATLARAWWSDGEPDSARASLEQGLEAGWRDPGERQAAEQQLAELNARASRALPGRR